ncbi:MAG TPA: DUF1292 domain-containing protein [Candidatus Ornithoclostridium faecavium]|nr:DUF1292 domain-containing protein [Candidatus Ornithoclostridium faecavium]
MSKKKEEIIDDEIEFVDEPEIVVLKGSDGREEELLLLAEIDYGDAVYAILQPSDLKDMEDDEVFVFEIEEAENGDRNYRPVEDKELAQSVMDDYNELRMGCDCDCEDCDGNCEDCECEGCDEECENAEECDKDCKKK